ncbi:MAG TPA: M28 family metallopeptidase [Longimicrobiales bacterium]|nr:M28 family metallopeptidase [Longimicrobiales bacterium]
MRSAAARATPNLAGPAGAALLLVLLASGCGGPGPADRSAGGPDELIQAVQAEIQVAAMNEELDSIVQYDRLSGSPGELAAMEYLRRTLEAEGIPVQVDTFMAYISDPVSASVEVPAAGFAPQAITVSGSGTVKNLQAQLVDVGTLEDLPPLLMEGGERIVLDADGPAGYAEHPPYPDVRGKIALVTGAPRPEPALQLTLMGAAGAVFVHPEELLNDLTITSVWGGPSLMDYHRIPTLPVAEVKRSDGDRLRALLAQGRVQLRMSTETKTGWKKLPLLVATVPGPTPDAPYVLAGGHLDAWYHGGTDNAGANVAMLETTRALFRHRSELRRGLVMAWWPGHSNGRYAGSTWFVDQKFDELRRRALAYVNYEGMGQIDAKRFGGATTASLSALARDVVLQETGDSIRPRPPGRSSDESFNGVGLPLLEISHSRLDQDGGYWWWHTPDDTRDKVDAEVLKVDADIYAAVLTRLLAEPVYPVSLTAVVERLGTLLAERQETAGTRLDLSEAMARQARLLETVKQVEAAAAKKPGPDMDLAVVALLRPLHRVLYTLLGPYHPDPAISEGPLPGLNAVDMLAANDPSTDRHQFARTTLLRELARILEALDDAQARAEALLGRQP